MIINQKESSISWIAVAILGTIILMNEIPIIPRSLYGNATMLPFAFMFILLSNKSRIIVNKKDIPVLLAFFLLVIMVLVYKLTGISTTGWGIYINTFSYYFFFWSMLTLCDHVSENKLRFLFIVLVGSLLFTIVQNTMLYNRYGFSYFMINTNDERVVTNASSTQFSTSIVLLGGILLIAFLSSKKHKIAWLFLLVSVTYFNIFVSQRAINLILTVFLYTYIILVNKKRKLYANVLLVFAAILLIAAITNYSSVIEFITNTIPSDRISEKLLQIKRALDAGDITKGGGSLTARYRLYTLSLDSWLSSTHSFFFGIGEHYENNLLIGNHSQFFDVLGQYGLIGAVLMYWTVVHTLKVFMEKMPVQKGSPLYRQISAVVIVFIIRGFIGTVLYGVIAIHLFIFTPMVLRLIQKEDVSL